MTTVSNSPTPVPILSTTAINIVVTSCCSDVSKLFGRYSFDIAKKWHAQSKCH